MAKITVKLPQFQAVGYYRIGGLLFRDGVATTDELSNSDREIIGMIGAEVEGDEPAAPAGQGEQEEREPAGTTPPADDAKDDETPEGETEDDNAAAPAEAPAVSSSFVDPTPTTDEQAAAAPFETATVASSTDGSTTETAPAASEA